jgi:prepilin-type N-terminal cleavage/methylation domain-containing protein
MSNNSNQVRGFSLIEVSLVLLLVGLLLSSLLVPLNAQLHIRKITTTDRQLSQIKQAIIAYSIVEQTLPCPDTNGDGLENISSTQCTNRDGSLPWRSLGLQAGQFDAWGRSFHYAIADGDYRNKDRNQTQKILTLANLNKATGVRIDIHNGGSIIDLALVVIYSVGSSGQAHAENANSDTTYLYADYIDGLYDDQLIWLSRYELVAHVKGYNF